jgi:hypothetical protein
MHALAVKRVTIVHAGCCWEGRDDTHARTVDLRSWCTSRSPGGRDHARHPAYGPLHSPTRSMWAERNLPIAPPGARQRRCVEPQHQQCYRRVHWVQLSWTALHERHEASLHAGVLRRYPTRLVRRTRAYLYCGLAKDLMRCQESSMPVKCDGLVTGSGPTAERCGT